MNSGRSLMKPSLPTLDERPSMPERSNSQFTNFANTSYGSNAPMLSQVGSMGRSSPAPPMPPLDRSNTGYFGDQHEAPYAASDRPYTPQGRATPMQRGPLPPVDTSYYNGSYEADQHDFRGPPPQATRPYQEFSPFDSRDPHAGPSYELSPVSPTEDISRHYFAESGPQDYQPPQLPSTLRTGSPAPSQPVGLPSQPRAGTAPPRPGVPASLQSATQRREASQPLPNRAMGGSAPPQQMRSATAPLQQQQPNWGPQRSYTPAAAPSRSYTPNSASAAPRGYDNSYNY
jgi:hypothetical protein